jgi:hypothetical protein
VGYTVVAATAMQYIARYGCEAAGKAAACPADALWLHVLIFSAVQVGGDREPFSFERIGASGPALDGAGRGASPGASARAGPGPPVS